MMVSSNNDDQDKLRPSQQGQQPIPEKDLETALELEMLENAISADYSDEYGHKKYNKYVISVSSCDLNCHGFDPAETTIELKLQFRRNKPGSSYDSIFKFDLDIDLTPDTVKEGKLTEKYRQDLRQRIVQEGFRNKRFLHSLLLDELLTPVEEGLGEFYTMIKDRIGEEYGPK